jgi:cytochrome c551/c552
VDAAEQMMAEFGYEVTGDCAVYVAFAVLNADATRDRYEAALRRIAAVECHLACKSVGPSFSQCARCEAREALAAAQEDTNG